MAKTNSGILYVTVHHRYLQLCGWLGSSILRASSRPSCRALPASVSCHLIKCVSSVMSPRRIRKILRKLLNHFILYLEAFSVKWADHCYWMEASVGNTSHLGSQSQQSLTHIGFWQICEQRWTCFLNEYGSPQMNKQTHTNW